MSYQNACEQTGSIETALPAVDVEAHPLSSACDMGTWRLGGSYQAADSEGNSIRILDLYRFNSLIKARCLTRDFPNLPEVGDLVTIQGVLQKDSLGEYVHLTALTDTEVLENTACVFDLVLPDWVVDSRLIDRAIILWRQLSPHYRELVNAVFANACILRNFMLGPGSLNGHHSRRGGNFQHAVETAESALSLVSHFNRADLDTTLSAALLHDAGKALEYVREGSGWIITDRGKLVGHKVATLQIVTLGLSKIKSLSPSQRNGLIHALSACPAPEWVGLRPPMTPEAMILSAVDRLNGKSDLIGSCFNPDSRWGRPHPHLPGSAFTLTTPLPSVAQPAPDDAVAHHE